MVYEYCSSWILCWFLKTRYFDVQNIIWTLKIRLLLHVNFRKLMVYIKHSVYLIYDTAVLYFLFSGYSILKPHLTLFWLHYIMYKPSTVNMQHKPKILLLKNHNVSMCLTVSVLILRKVSASPDVISQYDSGHTRNFLHRCRNTTGRFIQDSLSRQLRPFKISFTPVWAM